MITAGQSVEGVLHQIVRNQIHLDGIEIDGIGEGSDGGGYYPLGLAPCLQHV